MGSWLPAINVGEFVGNHVGTSRVVKRYLAVMKKAGIRRHEGKGNVCVWVIFEKEI